MTDNLSPAVHGGKLGLIASGPWLPQRVDGVMEPLRRLLCQIQGDCLRHALSYAVI